MSFPATGAALDLRLFAAGFLVQAVVTLILLLAAALVYRSFREKFLQAWLFGWVAFGVYATAIAVSASGPYARLWTVAAHAAFLFAVAQFSTAVLIYAGDEQRLPLLRALLVAGAAIAAYDLAVPSWSVLYWAMYGCSLAMALLAAQRLARFARGRGTVGPWLLSIALLLLHPDSAAGRTAHPVLDATVELLVGSSMLLVVLDDLRGRNQRLNVTSAINRLIAQEDDSQALLQRALREIMALTGADAAWVRLLDSGGLQLQAHIGLSPAYVAERRRLVLAESFSGRVLRDGRAAWIRTSDAAPEIGARLRQEGFDHVLIVPISGKSSAIGTLATASRRRRWYTRSERRFLAVAAGQLGIALENMRMFDQVLRAKMQWVSTFDSIEDPILVHDSALRVLRVNRALAKRLERQPIELVGLPVHELLSGAAQEPQCPYCARGMSAMEAPDPCFGGYSVVSTSSFSDAEQSGTIHIIRDTTSARTAEQRYRELFRGMQEGVFLSTEDGRLLDCNDAFVRLLGYAGREELLRVDIGAALYVNPEQRKAYRRAMAEKHFVRGFESLVRRKDGKIITVMENSSETRDAEGRVCYQGFVLDITEQKAAAEQIRRRNHELFALNRILTVAAQSMDLDEILNLALKDTAEVFEADCGGAFLFDKVNSALHRRATYGLTSKKARTVSSVSVPAELVRKIAASRTEVLTQQHLHFLPTEVQELVSAEGLNSWMWAILWGQDEPVGLFALATRSARDFGADDENLLKAIARQLATTVQKVRLYEATMRAYEDLQRAQQQLMQSEKMSAIGQLVSGVAHELNNPLTAILGYAQLLESTTTPERTADFAAKLYRQAQRTQKIVQNLLSFARQRQPEQRMLDLRKVIDDTVMLRDYDLKLNNITIERDYDAALPQVMADPHQLEQVFLNLINNAVDAILEKERKGRITLLCRRENGDVVIEIRDTGRGINDPAKVFDPFYTTKAIGKGTGLGLSICYSIVKQHGGEISAHNYPGGGAVFQVRLPITRGSARPAETLGNPSRIALSGRVLLVDDEEPILDFESEALRAGGAEVITAASGDAAYQKLQEENFDAIVSDATMPGKWTGLDLYRWASKARPELRHRFVLTVSNAADPEITAFVQETGIACMVKPFEMTDFLRLLRRTMENSRAAATV